MKPEEAIKIVEGEYVTMSKWWGTAEEARRHNEAIKMAIDALKKQIPVKPKRIDKNAEFDGNWKKVCPTCGRVLLERITTPEESYPIYYNMTDHCICGQAIYWSENECKKSRGRRWG